MSSAQGTDRPGALIPSTHPGVTDEQIAFGFVHVQGAEALGEALGTDARSGNTKRQIEAVVQTVNEAGGIAGRQVRLLTYPFRAGEPFDPQLQAACEHFTQDNKTFAVASNLGGLTGGGVLYECLGKNDVAYIENANAGDTELFEQFPNIAYAPSTLTADRIIALKIEALVQAGWFGSSPVIGLHSIDAPMWRRVVKRAVEPSLAAHGYAVKEEFYYSLGHTGTDGIPEYGAVTLRFKNSGVTHVLNVGNHPLVFASTAESQGWRPKWSVYSDIAPANWAPSTPRAQLEGSLGIGWAPTADMQPADRGDPVNRAETRCADIMEAAGEDPTPPLAWQYQLKACSSVFFLDAALEVAPDISTAGLAAALAALGDSHEDPGTWRTRFVPDRRDGLGAYRMLGYVSDCSCYRYASGLRAVP